MNEQGRPSGRAGGSSGDEQEVLFDLPEVPAVRLWTVDENLERYRAEMEVRFVFSEEEAVREYGWFAEFEYGRAITQVHVEQVMGKSLKDRRAIYKWWRQDLGDATARRYAKFAEYVIEHGRPKWFNEQITLYPDTIVLKPSSVSTVLPVSWSTLRPTPDVIQRMLQSSRSS